MKVKTSELFGPALDWAVAKCEDESVRVAGGRVRFALSQFTNDYDLYSPSTDWAQGGPIIEREITELYEHDALGGWAAKSKAGDLRYGPTTLIAAMRCYVTSELGDEIDIPEEFSIIPPLQNTQTK